MQFTIISLLILIGTFIVILLSVTIVKLVLAPRLCIKCSLYADLVVKLCIKNERKHRNKPRT